MDHIRVTFHTSSQANSDIVMAALIEIGFEGFEENESQLIGYIEESLYDKSAVEKLAKRYFLQTETEKIEAQNWNAQWEEKFQPVVIDGFCTILASFHTLPVATPHEILITPKMSFGTGHHATTQLMMLQMREVPFADKTVLDFGTGTGILAILAEQLGSEDILAIDNDEWSYNNAKENVEQNNCKHITVVQDTLTDDGKQYDIILANINRHILLACMHLLYNHTVPGGTIIMSGLMHADEEIVAATAVAEGFNLFNIRKQGDWLLLAFNRNS